MRMHGWRLVWRTAGNGGSGGIKWRMLPVSSYFVKYLLALEKR